MINKEKKQGFLPDENQEIFIGYEEGSRLFRSSSKITDYICILHLLLQDL